MTVHHLPESDSFRRSLLASGGETGALIAARDWSGTLGPVEGWPGSLRTALGLILRSPVPMVMLWGEDGIMLYNDGYAAFAGGRHPELLGSRVREGWPEAADFNDNVMRVGLAGETLAYQDIELTLFRHGRPEQVFMKLDYSPVPGEDGQPAGVLAVVVETTATVLAGRRRAAEHERLVKMYEQAPGFIAMLDGPDHVFGLVNAAYRELIGGRDVVGLPVRAALPEVAGQGFVDLLDRVHATGEPFRGEAVPVWLARTPGEAPEERFVDFIYQPVTEEGGRVTGIFVEGYDVTERMQVQNALRESEDHYRHAVELSPQVSWTATPDGLLDHVAPRWVELTGNPGLGASWGEAIHPEDLDASREAWMRAIATGEPYDIEHRVRLRDGRFHWMHSRAFPRRNPGGRIVKWYGTTEDVEERKAAEAVQRAQAEELRAVLDAVPAGIWITHDPDAREIAGNARSHEFLRVPQGRNQSKGAPDAPTRHFRFLDSEGRELAPRDLPVQAAARGEPVAGREYRVAFEDGSHLDLFGNATPLHDAQGRPAGSVAAFVDITGRKAVEAALREETRILETLNRAAAALAGNSTPSGWPRA
ncbi:PAS/PAC sensor hybrid histidine kinase [Rubellimicrobium mesophilum DSM 19309]|uniref:histidine kinase n=1 Tax=Rubellimicrobium mesophilum DSM 19309 TaxID=442562 RepID=A0A017HT40_9RHOB|nr:PAS domain-containing protein [Rubellimicrobium mesophilum]EYD76924.1 PAS/PAC sensor hybrid histidine kinase [Rubellimicrobium mesophilum DSM 19309]